MSSLKVCVEFLLLGQPFCVPGQHGFCHLATFGGDMGVPAKSLLARPTYCCSDGSDDEYNDDEENVYFDDTVESDDGDGYDDDGYENVLNDNDARKCQ